MIKLPPPPPPPHSPHMPRINNQQTGGWRDVLLSTGFGLIKKDLFQDIFELNFGLWSSQKTDSLGHVVTIVLNIDG